VPEESLEEKFPTMEEVDRFLRRERTHLMDLNHKMAKGVIREVERLEDYQEEFNNVTEEMKVALAVGAMLLARQVADRIQDDYGIVLTEELVSMEEEEEEE